MRTRLVAASAVLGVVTVSTLVAQPVAPTPAPQVPSKRFQYMQVERYEDGDPTRTSFQTGYEACPVLEKRKCKSFRAIRRAGRPTFDLDTALRLAVAELGDDGWDLSQIERISDTRTVYWFKRER
jgi:hypothetical protein